MKEEARPPANVVHIKGQDYLLEQKAYFDLEGREYYHGTQKGVFTSSDIGKIFVSERVLFCHLQINYMLKNFYLKNKLIKVAKPRISPRLSLFLGLLAVMKLQPPVSYIFS